MEKQGGAFRKKKIYFTQVGNEALDDKKLSLKAKGLYSLIQRYITIENFTLYKNTLKNKSTDRDTSFNGAWKELKDNGYLIQHKSKGSKGEWVYEYELLDRPYIENPGVENPHVENPDMENPPSGKSTGGKPTLYNNTNLNNTINNNTNLNNTNKKEKRKTDIDKAIDIYTTNENLKITLYDYIKMRKSIKKPMNDRALKLLFTALDKETTSDDIKIRMLEQSILKCWLSVYPLKEEAKKDGSSKSNIDQEFINDISIDPEMF